MKELERRVNVSFRSLETIWLRAVEAVLRSHGYVKLISKLMTGLILMINLLESLFPQVCQVSVDSAGCDMFFLCRIFKKLYFTYFRNHGNDGK
jgi:hypothetical protein